MCAAQCVFKGCVLCLQMQFMRTWLPRARFLLPPAYTRITVAAFSVYGGLWLKVYFIKIMLRQNYDFMFAGAWD